MMRYAGLPIAVVAAVLVLPHRHSFAQFFPVFPDLTIKQTILSQVCAGPARLRLFLSIEIRNIGKGPAIRPSPFTPWYSIRDRKSGGPPGVHAMPPDQLLAGQAVTFKDQAVLQQMPDPIVGIPKTYEVAWEIKVDPFNSIIETSEINNIAQGGLITVNKPKGIPTDFFPARCK
jgi:hypothetical protein